MSSHKSVRPMTSKLFAKRAKRTGKFAPLDKTDPKKEEEDYFDNLTPANLAAIEKTTNMMNEWLAVYKAEHEDKKSYKAEELDYELAKTYCTYQFGYITQELFSCLTCQRRTKKQAVICLGCATQCHKGHELHNLSIRRHFRCDCGNSLFQCPRAHYFKCSLIEEKEDENFENLYDHTCSAVYCYCEQPENKEEMFQCIICEDFFHYKCLNIYNFHDFPSYIKGELICYSCLMNLQDILLDFKINSFILTSGSKDLKYTYWVPESNGVIEKTEDVENALEYLGKKRPGGKKELLNTLKSLGVTFKNPENPVKGKAKLSKTLKKLKPSNKKIIEDEYDDEEEEVRQYCLKNKKNRAPNTKFYNKIIKNKNEILIDGEKFEKALCHCDNCRRVYEEKGFGFLGENFYTEDWKNRIMFDDSDDDIMPTEPVQNDGLVNSNPIEVPEKGEGKKKKGTYKKKHLKEVGAEPIKEQDNILIEEKELKRAYRRKEITKTAYLQEFHSFCFCSLS